MLCDTNIISVVGFRGVPGATPNVTATATTGAPGTSASVTKTGTNTNPVFNFTIPKGDPGVNGLSGSGVVRNTVAELRTVVGTNTGDAATTLGCLSAGDGGDGLWRWDAASIATDNTGTVVKPTAVASNAEGRWLRVNTDEVWVKWFGAKGDNSVDDAPAIQAAVDYAVSQAALGRSVPVYLNPGRYRIDSTIRLFSHGTKGSGASAYLDFDYTSITFGSPSFGYVGGKKTEILPTFKNGPAIAIHLARNTRVFGFSILGQANPGYATPGSYRNLLQENTQWWNPNNAQDSRYAPHCGIAIDPFCRMAPVRVYFSADADTPPTAVADYTPLPEDLWYIGNVSTGPFELRQLNGAGVWETLRQGVTMPASATSTPAFGDLYKSGYVYRWDGDTWRRTDRTYPNTHRYYGFRNGGHYTGLRQYYNTRNRTGSTGIYIERIEAQGFICGISLSPSLGEGATDAAFPGEASLGVLNGDHIFIKDCNVSYNKVGIAVGQSQNRSVELHNIYVKFNRTFVDCASYGNGSGPFPAIMGGGFVWVRNFFLGQSAWGYGNISQVYAESLGTLGYWGVNGGLLPLTVTGCTFKFIPQTATDTDPRNLDDVSSCKSSPDSHLQNAGPVVFTGCYLGQYNVQRRRLSFVNTAQLTFEGCTFDAPPNVTDMSLTSFDNCGCIYTGQGALSLKKSYIGTNLATLSLSGREVQGSPNAVIEEGSDERYTRYKSVNSTIDFYPVAASPFKVQITHITDANGNTGFATFAMPDNSSLTSVKARLMRGSYVTTLTAWYGGTPSADGTNTVSHAKAIIGRVIGYDGDIGYLEGVPVSLTSGEYVLYVSRLPEFRPKTVGNLTNGSTVVTSVVSTGLSGWNAYVDPGPAAELYSGEPMWSRLTRNMGSVTPGSRIRGNGIPEGTYVVARDTSANTITLSQAATATSTLVELYDAKLVVDYACRPGPTVLNNGAALGGVWVRGDYINNASGAAKDSNGMVVLGWVCTVSGAPGTWEPVYGSAVSPAA